MIRLGEMDGPVTGIAFRFNEALNWLTFAEHVIAAAPSCNLPVVDRFRRFVGGVAATNEAQTAAVMNLTPSDIAGMESFAQCANAKDTRLLVEAKDAADAAAADRRQRTAVLVLGAGLALLGVGWLVTKSKA